MTVAVPGAAASSYASGGGGVVLEHRYGATLLASLLSGDPLPELGDDVTPTEIRFQASAVSAVDDLLISGRTPDGGLQRASVGVRREPKLIKSEAKSKPGEGEGKAVRLIATYLKVVAGAWDEITGGRWRLVLATVTGSSAAREAGKLAEIARDTGSEAAFREELAHGEYKKNLRDRLVHLDSLVTAAIQSGCGTGGLADGEMTWRWLFSLRDRELRLEGADTTDRTFTVAQLRAVTADGTNASADALLSKLEGLSARYAPAGATVDEATLRRDLSGTALTRSSRYPKAWNVLDRLTVQLADDTRDVLADSTSELRLDRDEASQVLLNSMRTAATAPGALVITGEPDVGKSVLSLRTGTRLAEMGTSVISLSLRDLPSTVLELEGQMNAPLAQVLGGTATGEGRLLLVDGTEAVLEGRAKLLATISAAALRAGLGVAAVTRADGARAVSQTLAGAASAAGLAGPVAEHVVGRLSSAEVTQVGAAFPVLGRLVDDPRAAWLLGRLGLVDLLLRAGAVGDLPSGPLCEADVFAVLWDRLVRNGEMREPGGPTPDAREQALIALARRRLLPADSGQPPDMTALPALRSDGLLQPPGATSAWRPGERFASDLVADLALARLLIIDSWELLSRGGAPRWALRAARLACQAMMVAAGPESEQARAELAAIFGQIAEQAGARWAEVPDEALLTIGSGRRALDRAWPALLAGDRAGLQTLLRLAHQRYVADGVGDVAVLEPLVELGYCGDDLGQDDTWDPSGTGNELRRLVIAWLRGLIAAESGPDALRQRVRDRILGRSPEQSDEFAIEALATLGPDLDDRAETFLRAVPGGYLEPAVERAGPTIALTSHQPALLLALAESYYLMDPAECFGLRGFRDGIRPHHALGHGPRAGWLHGPFFQLLCARPADALALINKILDHAATICVGAVPPPGPDAPGLDLDLPGVGTRHCVGDRETWAWYRGGTTAPPPCVSALLGVERWADHLLDVLQAPVPAVTGLMLRDCRNLAMPGLTAGVLVRHLELAGTQLDPWLARPELWEMEVGRFFGEAPGTLHIQGPDPADLHGRARRDMDFGDVAAEMTVRAALDGDHERLAALAAIGDQLVQRAQDLAVGRDDARKWMAVFLRNAATLHPANHHPVQSADGITFVFRSPDDVAKIMASFQEPHDREKTALWLQLTYTSPTVWEAPVDALLDDLTQARELAEGPPPGLLRLADPIAAVAAAAISAHARGRATVPDDDLQWAAGVLVKEAAQPSAEARSSSRMGADRSAAAALPALLLPELAHVRPDMSALEDALHHAGTSVTDEVRMIFAHAAGQIWTAPCGHDGNTCYHHILWTAVLGGLRDCQLGAWNQATQRRLIEPLAGPFDQTLPGVQTERLLLNRLTSPLIAAADAARSRSCIADQASRLLDVLLAAHCRGAVHWAEKNYEPPSGDEHRPAVARILAETAAAGNTQPLAGYVRAFTRQSPQALAELLHNLAIVFTYDDDLRQALPAAWPPVMQAALDELEADPDLPADRHWSPVALAALIPAPDPSLSDVDPDASIAHARQRWPAPDTYSELIMRWLAVARGYPRAADALVKLGRCAPLVWQATTGLRWMEEIISGNYAAFAGRCYYLAQWLGDIRAALPGNAEIARWRRLVDGLAGAGDNRAARLQQAEE